MRHAPFPAAAYRAGASAATLACLALIVFVCSTTAAAGEEPPEPADYRTQDYRGPVPSSLAGARVVATTEAAALWRDQAAVFVDVMPRAPRPPNLPPGTIWRDKPRHNIPGSAWLPDTGYGELAASTEAYLQNALETLTAGNRERPILVYCLRDCWMSWNAAKRAVSWGYTNVIWFPEGTDGWGADDLPFAQAQPWRPPGG
jgi:PQQ-dependent catabolism-associated CXXCW motif protein